MGKKEAAGDGRIRAGGAAEVIVIAEIAEPTSVVCVAAEASSAALGTDDRNGKKQGHDTPKHIINKLTEGQ